MWVMLIKKLQTIVSPPKLSLHWAEPWPMDDKYTRRLAERVKSANKYCDRDEGFIPYDEVADAFSGQPLVYEERRLRGAMCIVFMGERIRIFPEEFSVVSAQNMAEYINPAEGSHYLIEEDIEASRVQVPSTWESKEKKLLFEAALLDGCSIVQAFNVMEGKDVDFDADLFPPVMGWYRAKEEYSKMFCRAGEDEIMDCRDPLVEEAAE
jgi:hypothetical protein